MQHQMSFLDMECGRMSPELSAPQKARTFEQSSKRSAKLKTVTPLYLDLRRESGLTQERSWETGIPSHGESSTLNFGAYPSVVEESFLRQILEANVPEKYSSSAKACEGILRRAERRGKELPSLLHFALMLKSEKLFTENVGADSSFYHRLCNFAEMNECDAVIAYKPTPAIIASFMGGQGAKAGGIAYSEDLAPTLKSAPSGSNTVPDVVYCVFDARGNGDGKICPTITGDHENCVTDYTAVLVSLCYGWYPQMKAECVTMMRDKSPCLVNGTNPGFQNAVLCIALDRAAYNQGANAQFDPGIDGETGKAFTVIAKGPGAVYYAIDMGGGKSACGVSEDTSPTLTCTHGGEPATFYLTPVEIILRRLTPTECARLQGMPDWWCDDVPHSDSAEYKMWGNGMALPCVLYVMEGVAEALME